MEKQNPQQVAQNIFDKNQTVDQFAVANTPFHTHNGSDSQKIDYGDLINRLIILSEVIQGTSAQTAANYGVFFTAPFKCVFIGATEVHQVAETTATTCKVYIEKLIGTTASGSGTNLFFKGTNVLTVAIASGGMNYAVNDTITLTGGTAIQQVILKVLTITGSAVATVAVTNSGNYSAFPSNPVSQGSTSGSGTGATFNFTLPVTGFDLTATANTLQTAILAQATNNLFNLNAGDRLGFVFSSTGSSPANLKQVQIMVQLTY